jgi:hypothetical protein
MKFTFTDTWKKHEITMKFPQIPKISERSAPTISLQTGTISLRTAEILPALATITCELN